MERILVNIDSRQRDIELFPQSNYFKLQYNDIDKSGNYYKNNNYINFKNVDYITLSSFEMMNNFYVFQTERYNTFFYIIYNDETTYTIEIDPGNYTYNELINALNYALNKKILNVGSYDAKGDFIVTSGLYFSVNSYTNTITLYNDNSNINYTVNFDNDKYDYISLGYVLGYRSNEYTLNNNKTITGEAQADLDGENYIFLRINDYGSIYISPKMPSKVLAKVVLDATKQGFVYNTGQDLIYKTHNFRQPTDVKNLEIELLDYNGNRLNINGIDFSFTLEFGLIYDEELYQKKLHSLKLTSDWPNNDMFNGFDESSNHKSVNTISHNLNNDIQEEVIDKTIEIKPIEEQTKPKKKKDKKKNKFNIIY